MTHVSGLFIYPIKGCGGISMSMIQVHLARGIVHDRAWMLVDEEGTFLSQRKHPRMALIRPRLEGPNLIVEAPGQSPAHIDYVSWNEVGRPRHVRVHDDTVKGIDYGDGAAGWFSAALGTRCRLVGRPRGLVRSAPQGDAWLSYADAYPFLVVSQASLDDLNGRLADPVAMNRFRPNLVVDGGDPYAEDAWPEIDLEGVRLIGQTRCTRCAVITVDQDTGESHPRSEPLRTLSTYRRAPELGNKPVFGRNFGQASEGTIVLGQSVVVSP